MTAAEAPDDRHRDEGASSDLDLRESARTRRRDRDLSAEARDLMRPGMGKVFKQIQDAQAKAAKKVGKQPERRVRP